MAPEESGPPSFEAWLSQIEADVAEMGFAGAWAGHFEAVVKAHGPANAASMLGANLERILRSDREIAAELGTAGVRTGGTDVDVAAIRDGRWRNVLNRPAAAPAIAIDELKERDGTPVRCIEGTTFENWGRTVCNVPALTCFPRSKAGVCNIVKWAASKGKKVRASGYRHSWSDIFSSDGGVLISLLPLDVVNVLPAVEPPIDPKNELQGIEVVGTITEDGTTKALCRIGAATTNEQFRRWCLDPKGGNLSWTVPLNVIMVEITWGGSNAPICHGAGWKTKTLSDLVAEIEFVNAAGQLQVVKNPAQLGAAAGAFGLMGVVTSITLKLDPMTFARLQPIKKRVALAVPPTSRSQVPAGVDMAGVTDADLDSARTDFVRRCEQDYYAEWFWFTLQQDCWINTWKNDGKKADAVDYPSPFQTALQEAEEYVAGLLIESHLFSCLSQVTQAKLLGGTAMATLPVDETITTPLIDGLHFRRGIQNMRAIDMEWEIPIPGRPDDSTKPDWSICQDAWWAVIREVYRLAQQGKAPMRLTLEMRVTGDSGVTMAPQYGNEMGTCSIEVLTTLDTDHGEWARFVQTVIDAWAGLSDATGRPLNVRPHWAKQWQGFQVRGQWQGFQVRGMAVVDYLRTKAYPDRISEFKRELGAIAQQGGTTVKDMQRLFSTPLLDEVFRDAFA
jgi:hypothetical protein